MAHDEQVNDRPIEQEFMPNKAVIELGSRIKAARLRMRWSQKRLADALQWNSSQIVSNVESGERELKAWELAQIARILNTTFDTLLNPTTNREALVLWRAKPKDEERAGEIEAKFLTRCSRYAQLEKWCELPTPEELKPLSINSLETPIYAVQKEAAIVRDAMKLGGRPACTLEKTLEEDYGVKIFYEDLGASGSALCARNDFGSALLLNASEVPWRRNYSLAHELFHLMTPTQWDGERCEQLADAFASALLLPQESLTSSIHERTIGKKIQLERLVEIACEFGVSIDALCWRLVNLNILKRDKVLAELKPDSELRRIDHFSRRAYPSSEPQQGLPERYIRLAYLAYAKGKLGRSKLAEYLEISAYDLAEYLNSNSEALSGAETEIAVVGC
jgi:XRE family transcriptional regulator, fatty acid utilization regulator